MKRNFTLKIALFVLVLFSVASCSNSSKDYVSVIPKNAAQIVSVDLNSLSTKAGLGDAENDSYKELLISELNKEMPELSTALVKELVNDPTVSGIDFQVPIYVFNQSPEAVSPNLVAKMGDKAKFETVLTQISDKNELKTKVEKDDYTYMEDEKGTVAIAYNDEVILIVTQVIAEAAKPVDEVVTELFKNSEGENIYQNKSFEKMTSLDGDIKLFTTLKSIPNNFKSQMSMVTNMAKVDLTDFTVIMSAGFDAGEVNLYLTAYSENPEAQALFEETLKKAKAMNGDLFKKFPANSLAVMATYLDGNLINEELQKNPEFTKEFKNHEESAKQIMSFIACLDGDFVVSPIHFNNITDFSVLALAEVNDDATAALEAFYNDKDINSGIIAKKGDGAYAFESRFLSLYFGVKDGLFYFSNKKDVDLSKVESPSISDAYTDTKGKTGCLIVNCEAVLDVLTAMRMTRSIPRELREPIKEIKTIEMSATPDGLVNYKVILKNQDANSLKQIVDLAKAYAN